jgi:hypothetical protein
MNKRILPFVLVSASMIGVQRRSQFSSGDTRITGIELAVRIVQKAEDKRAQHGEPSMTTRRS